MTHCPCIFTLAELLWKCDGFQCSEASGAFWKCQVLNSVYKGWREHIGQPQRKISVRPVPVKMRSFCISTVGLQGNKKADTYVRALICILEQLVHNVPERACLAGRGKGYSTVWVSALYFFSHSPTHFLTPLAFVCSPDSLCMSRYERANEGKGWAQPWAEFPKLLVIDQSKSCGWQQFLLLV